MREYERKLEENGLWSGGRAPGQPSGVLERPGEGQRLGEGLERPDVAGEGVGAGERGPSGDVGGGTPDSLSDLFDEIIEGMKAEEEAAAPPPTKTAREPQRRQPPPKEATVDEAIDALKAALQEVAPAPAAPTPAAKPKKVKQPGSIDLTLLGHPMRPTTTNGERVLLLAQWLYKTRYSSTLSNIIRKCLETEMRDNNTDLNDEEIEDRVQDQIHDLIWNNVPSCEIEYSYDDWWRSHVLDGWMQDGLETLFGWTRENVNVVVDEFVEVMENVRKTKDLDEADRVTELRDLEIVGEFLINWQRHVFDTVCETLNIGGNSKR